MEMARLILQSGGLELVSGTSSIARITVLQPLNGVTRVWVIYLYLEIMTATAKPTSRSGERALAFGTLSIARMVAPLANNWVPKVTYPYLETTMVMARLT